MQNPKKEIKYKNNHLLCGKILNNEHLIEFFNIVKDFETIKIEFVLNNDLLLESDDISLLDDYNVKTIGIKSITILASSKYNKLFDNNKVYLYINRIPFGDCNISTEFINELDYNIYTTKIKSWIESLEKQFFLYKFNKDSVASEVIKLLSPIILAIFLSIVVVLITKVTSSLFIFLIISINIVVMNIAFFFTIKQFPLVEINIIYKQSKSKKNRKILNVVFFSLILPIALQCIFALFGLKT